MLLPETLVMLYMKVVGKSREEVCVDFRTCFVSFYWTAEASPPDCVIVSWLNSVSRTPGSRGKLLKSF